MHRHASIGEQIGFIFFGAPYRLVRLVIREAKKGEFDSTTRSPTRLSRFFEVKGITRGIVDVFQADRIVGRIVEGNGAQIFLGCCGG
jgi:hypothetical protein